MRVVYDEEFMGTLRLESHSNSSVAGNHWAIFTSTQFTSLKWILRQGGTWQFGGRRPNGNLTFVHTHIWYLEKWRVKPSRADKLLGNVSSKTKEGAWRVQLFRHAALPFWSPDVPPPTPTQET